MARVEQIVRDQQKPEIWKPGIQNGPALQTARAATLADNLTIQGQWFESRRQVAAHDPTIQQFNQAKPFLKIRVDSW